jgi:hypothetical protein
MYTRVWVDETMSSQIIEFVETRETIRTITTKDSFSFRVDRPCHWLQRLCFWVLQKIRAYHVYDKIEFTRHAFKPEPFMERIFRQKSNIQEMFNHNPTFLFIGAEDFEKMMGTEKIWQMFTFSASYMRGHTVMGLTVKVIPWMRGMLVI